MTVWNLPWATSSICNLISVTIAAVGDEPGDSVQLRSCEVYSLLAIIVDMQAFNKMPMNSGYCVYQLGVDSCLNINIIVIPSESSHQYL